MFPRTLSDLFPMKKGEVIERPLSLGAQANYLVQIRCSDTDEYQMTVTERQSHSVVFFSSRPTVQSVLEVQWENLLRDLSEGRAGLDE